MQVINQFIFNTLIFLILIISLLIILFGGVYVLKIILENCFDIDFDDVIKIRRKEK